MSDAFWTSIFQNYWLQAPVSTVIPEIQHSLWNYIYQALGSLILHIWHIWIDISWRMSSTQDSMSLTLITAICIKTYHQQTNSSSLLTEVEVHFQVQLLFLSFLYLWRGPTRKLLLLLGLPFYLFISQSLVPSFFYFSLIGITYNSWTLELKCSWLLKKCAGD